MADVEFDFERSLAAQQQEPSSSAPSGHDTSMRDKPRNYRQTVCTYWLRGLCMKGDSCGFLHQFEPSRMPVCRNLLKMGVCKDIDCPYKHTTEEIKECNMYRLGFCIYGPACRFKHTRLPGPPPEPAELEAAKPAEFRNITIVANQANEGISAGGGLRRFRAPSNALALQDGRDGGRGAQQQREPRERQAYQRGPQHSSVLAAVGQQGNPYGF